MAETEDTKVEFPLFGCFVLLGLVIGLAISIYGGYRAIVEYRKGPPPVIALSAYFVEGPPPSQTTSAGGASNHLKIKGDVRKQGKPVGDGNILLTVARTDLRFEQAVAVDLKPDGQFETEDASFAPLLPDDQIQIKAEFTSSSSAEPYSQDLYLNTNRPSFLATITAWAFGVLILLAIGFFFYAFTGARTNRKNQYAIIFSYCIIIIFLAVPLLAPVLLLSAFPNARRNMIGAPAGLIVTCVGDPKDCTNQWALNIGGYSTLVSPSPAPSPSGSPAPTSAPTSVPSPTPTKPAVIAQASVSPTPQSANSPQPTADGSPRPATATPTPTAAASISPSPEKLVPTKFDSSKDSDAGNEVLKVEGGLVIPLYVIVLSVIGGAINMTRKVPQLQGEGERSDARLPDFKGAVKSFFPRLKEYMLRKRAAKRAAAQSAAAEQTTASIRTTGDAQTSTSAETQSDDETLEAQASKIEAKLAPLVETYFARDSEAKESKNEIKLLAERMYDIFEKREDKNPILGFDSFDDWMAAHAVLKEMFASHWRVELLSQYMYLISAPFLAIVAYYMMGLLGFTKLPILVLISFSVGLISEKILNWLLSLASSYLKSDSAETVPTK